MEDSFIEELRNEFGTIPKTFTYDLDYNSRRPRLESRMSICLPSKGFINEPGENNCFLNAAIQLLWHVNVFRRSFRLLDGHACVENACIFCSLKKIFHQLGSDGSVVAAHEMRQAMANAFVDERRFQLGRMDDAAECYENILMRLHYHTAWREPEESCSIQHCIPHQKFALHILEQTFCKCKATSEPKPFYQFVNYVVASILVQQSKVCQRENRPLRLGELLKHTAQYGDTRPCPDEKRCRYKGNNENLTRIENTLLNRPDVVTVGIIWDTDTPSSTYILEVMDCISENLFINDMFDRILEDDYKHLEMKLAGVVTYYGRHYTSFFYNIREKQWLYFDDTQVTKIGASWENVKIKCERTRFQPLLIVFTNGSGSLVNVEKAPKSTEKISKDLLLTVQTPYAKPTTRKKHAKKHKKGRHTSRSPTHSPDKVSAAERTSSRSSNGSVSPTSPRRNVSSADTNKKGESLARTALENRYEPSYYAKLNDDPSSYSRPPKALLSLKGSASDGSIADIALMNGERDFMEGVNPKRNGSMKKRAVNVLKSMNPYKSLKPKNANIPSPEYEVEPPTPSILADIGYTSPYNKRSQPTEIPPSPPNTRLQNGHPSPNENSPNNQLKNLEIHKEILGKTDHHKPKHRHHRSNGSTHSEEHNGQFIRENGSTCDPQQQQQQQQQQRDNNLINFNGRPEVFHEQDNYKNEERFQELLGRADTYFNNSETCERKGDIVLAWKYYSEATATYRDASRIPGINADLIQYVDNRRTESFKRTQQLQRQVGTILKEDEPRTGYNERPNATLTRTESTSGYSSMSETLPVDDYRKPPYGRHQNFSQDTGRESVAISGPPSYARDSQTNDLINLQNPRHQAMDKLRQNYLQHPPQQDWTASSADSIRRASFGILPQHRKPLKNVVPIQAHTQYSSKTLPHPSKTTIRWVNGNQSESTAQENIDDVLNKVPQTLRKPDIPIQQSSSHFRNDGSVVTIFDDNCDENVKNRQLEFEKMTVFDDLRNGLPQATLSADSPKRERSRTADPPECSEKANQSTYPSYNTLKLSGPNKETGVRLPQQSIHAMLRNNGAARVTSGSFDESKSDTRKHIRSIYDNVENDPVPPQQELEENENFHTIYDDNVKNVNNRTVEDKNEDQVPSAKDLIKRLNQNNSVTKQSADSTNASIINSSIEADKCNETAPKPKDIIEKFSKHIAVDENFKEDLNTLQRLNKEGKISARCPQCKWRKVEKAGDFCTECRTEYLSILKKKVDSVPESKTLEKLRKGEIKKFKCEQCGWKQVEQEGKYCNDCQSEYL